MPDVVTDHPGPLLLAGRQHHTRLLDRALFLGQLRRAVVRNEGIPGGLAVLAVTPDPLTSGPISGTGEIGEEICLITAGRLVGCLHYSYSTTRVASGEFVVVAEGIGTLGGAVDLAEQILFAVRQPEMVRAGGQPVTASVGLAMQEPSASAEQLQNNASVAMYLARTGGGNRYQVYGDWVSQADIVATRAS